MCCRTLASFTLPPGCCHRRYFTCALKHSQELAEQVRLAAQTGRSGHVEMQEQVEMMLLDVFLEGLFEVDLRRINSEEVRACVCV